MKPLSFMLIAGEASGDLLAAELVNALREKIIARTRDGSADVQPLQTALAPRYFGAGGLKMAEAGVDLAIDLTQHSVIGISDVLKNFGKFRRIFRHLFQLAIERQPDVIVGIDYGGFNLRFAKAIKNYVRNHRSEFTPWNPRIVQFVSPQVWASRPGRAYTIAATHDLLLCIFPFEKAWYRQRVPGLRVEFVGHPMIGRSPRSKVQGPRSGECYRYASEESQSASLFRVDSTRTGPLGPRALDRFARRANARSPRDGGGHRSTFATRTAAGVFDVRAGRLSAAFVAARRRHGHDPGAAVRVGPDRERRDAGPHRHPVG
jgi:hypothetical protein